MDNGRLALHASAWVELHAWLATAAKTDADVGPELDPAKQAYRRSLADDEDDALLFRTTRALDDCDSDACAVAAVEKEGFGHAYARALPVFTKKRWLERATISWSGIEAAQATLGPSVDALLARASTDLAIPWPDRPVTIAVVADAPESSRRALIPAALSARGSCFVRGPRSTPVEVVNARIIDCAFVHAALAAPAAPLRTALARDLGAREGERAWTALVVHAVAAIITGWEPRHRSVYVRSAKVVEPKVMEWLGREWRGSHPGFVPRYVAAWQESR